jgi:hypothetical protein
MILASEGVFVFQYPNHALTTEFTKITAALMK